MAVEVEAKFLAVDDDPLDALAGASTLGPAELGPPTTVGEIDVYLDTPDGRLAAGQWACRLRDRGAGFRVSLKGPAVAAADVAWLHRRPEVEGPATASFDPADWPPSEARKRLIEMAGGGPLIERFRLLQHRTERAVTVEGRGVGTLSLDRATVARAGELLGLLHVVELELARGEDPVAGAVLPRLADALAGRAGLEADRRTKLEHAEELLAGR
jgi:inorganic triphosphatase YgiF